MLEPLRRAAADEGFVLCGVSPAVDSSGFSNLVRWIDSGYAGQMQYFSDRLEAYQHPSGVLAAVKSVCALAYPYDRAAFERQQVGCGKVARYAWSGVDYHDTLHPKLKRLCQILKQSCGASIARGVVDTAPLLEREVAQLAGLGWRGKNTLLLNKQLGSYFFLACLLCDTELPYDQPHASEHCGTCTACLDACPTDAFEGAGILNATRCISYLTIEHRGHIPTELRPAIGDWVFGCDVCQEVCPWNRKPARQAASEAGPMTTLELTDLFSVSDEQFRQRFRKTPLWRTRRRGILRNAAIVLGNQRHPHAIPALIRGLADGQPIVRAASVWALARFEDAKCRAAIRARLDQETDPEVIKEIDTALNDARHRPETNTD
jgi:epoxyqueuosine reductase